MTLDIIKQIQAADRVLIGIGEEFELPETLQRTEEYQRLKEDFQNRKIEWALPAMGEYFLCQRENKALLALQQLEQYIQDTDYFIVSTCRNDIVWKSGFKQERIVTPCGGSLKKQCIQGCLSVVEEVTEQEIIHTKHWIEKGAEGRPELGRCPKCESEMVFQNIYAPHYNEEGYFSQWEIYTKWLQETLNKKVCILELGVGIQYPTVIRWPFEKVAFYNNKAFLVRIHQKLYQISEELKEKAESIACNSVEWLLEKNE